MTSPQSPQPNYRDLLAKLDREQDRVRDENEYMRLDAEVEAAAKIAERELRAQLGLQIPGNAVRSVLPANTDPIVPQDPARRAAFALHLAEMAEGAVLDQAKLQIDPVEAESQPTGRDTLSGNVCAACRGSCCRSGGDEAYLTEETMLRSLQAHPDWSLARIVDTYVSYIPRESVADSCIYHGVKGCGLPRSLRSSTCNRYLCGKLRNLQGGLPEQNPPPVLAVLFDHGQWARSALVDQAGVRILAEEAEESDR